MRTAKKLLLASTLSLSLGAFVASAKATTLELNATAQTRAAIVLTEAAVMNFGIIDYLAVNSGSITLTPAGAISGGTGVTFSDSGPATKAAGHVTVVGDGASTVDVACDATATLGNGTDSLTIDNIVVSLTAAPTGTPCSDGVASVTTMDLTTDGDLYFGADVNLTTPIASDGTYNSTTGTGTTITLAVTYQ